MLMFWYACQRLIPGEVSITADTGSENDRRLSTGEVITAEDFFNQFVVPMSKQHGIPAYFVRAKNKAKQPRMELWEYVKHNVAIGKKNLQIPVFGSNGGRLVQTCTDNWKIGAIKQCGRSLGAKTMHCSQGLHKDELIRRMKGRWLRTERHSGFDYNIFQTISRSPKGKPPIEIKWLTHSYPLADRGLSRAAINEQLDALGIRYLKTSECDMCPHKDWTRWALTSPEVIDEIEEVETALDGKFFFTDLRIPIKRALPIMQQKYEAKVAQRLRDGVQANIFGDLQPDFGCKNDTCGM